MITRLLIFLIYGYRWIISPYIGQRCRFEPTCSRYGIQALQRHGLKKGLSLIIRRLIRCHPIKRLGGSWGYDPVPSDQPSNLPCNLIETLLLEKETNV